MPVEYYLHTPILENLNEKRAFMRVAQLLQQRYGHSTTPFTLIANVQPEANSPLAGLPQLDAVLLGPQFIAFLEFKNYFDPIQAHYLDGKWKTISHKKSQIVAGGTKRNPYLQARHARKAWQAFLDETLSQDLNTFILFHPYLHQDSKLPQLGKDNYWLRISSIENILELIFTTSSRKLSFSLSQQQIIAQKDFHAQPWLQLSGLLSQIVAYLHVFEPGQNPIRYPIYAYDDFTLGRSARQKHRVHLRSSSVSSAHAHIYTHDLKFFVSDLGSKNGTFVNGIKVLEPTQIYENERVLLGGTESNATAIWIQMLKPELSDVTAMTQ